MLDEAERLKKLIEQCDVISPCACCGQKLAWIYAGDGTSVREVLTGKQHKCQFDMNSAPKGTYRWMERELIKLQKEIEELKNAGKNL